MKNSTNSIKTTYETMQDYAKTLESRISFLEKKQSKLPREHIKYVRKGERVQYYLRHPNHTIEYIKTNQKSLIQNLVNAHYTRLALAKLKKNYKAAKLFLTFHSKKEERDIAESLPLQMQLLNDNLFPCRHQAIKKWQAEPYQRNPYMPESLMHTSNRGDKLRSKSEVMIADRIENRKIPFKPEFPIYLKMQQA